MSYRLSVVCYLLSVICFWIFTSRRFVSFLAPIAVEIFLLASFAREQKIGTESGKMDSWKCPSHSLLTVVGCRLSVVCCLLKTATAIENFQIITNSNGTRIARIKLIFLDSLCENR